MTLSYTIPSIQPVGSTLPDTDIRQMCLKFWYYFGAPVGTTQSSSDYFKVKESRLNSVMIQSDGQSIRSFNMQNQWQFKRTNILLAANQQVNLIAQTSSPYSVIAFDDIQVQEQLCEQPGWCDFENGI